MVNVEDQFRDVMHRTMQNLAIIEELARELPHESQRPFEVTQLVNSVMGAVAWPRERELSNKLRAIQIADAIRMWRLPAIVDEYPENPPADNRDAYKPHDLDKLMALLRHAFAHGNFRFEGGVNGQIERVHLWNVIPQNRKFAGMVSWGTTLSIQQLRELLEAFVLLAEHLYERDRAHGNRDTSVLA